MNILTYNNDIQLKLVNFTDEIILVDLLILQFKSNKE